MKKYLDFFHFSFINSKILPEIENEDGKCSRFLYSSTRILQFQVVIIATSNTPLNIIIQYI